MCNHYHLSRKEEALEYAEKLFLQRLIRGELDEKENEEAWPKSRMPILRRIDKTETIELATIRWGAEAIFYRNDIPRYITNARDDSLMTKSIWSRVLKDGRCLIPADAFYEWTGPAGLKHEVKFTLSGGWPFFFAGLITTDQDKRTNGFSLVTCKPNELLAKIHDRMPLILTGERAKQWMLDDTLVPNKIHEFCTPYPADEMVREDMPRKLR